jgi:hypothetical protein
MKDSLDNLVRGAREYGGELSKKAIPYLIAGSALLGCHYELSSERVFSETAPQQVLEERLQPVPYRVNDRQYLPLGLRYPDRHEFYVHIPQGTRISGFTARDFGPGLFGFAIPSTRELAVRTDVSSEFYTEILLHEAVHIVHPDWTEAQVREHVRRIAGYEHAPNHFGMLR